jgi:hypothetical protein
MHQGGQKTNVNILTSLFFFRLVSAIQKRTEAVPNNPNEEIWLPWLLHASMRTYTVTDRNVGTRYLCARTHRNVGKIAGNFKRAKNRVKQHYFVSEKLYLASAN